MLPLEHVAKQVEPSARELASHAHVQCKLVGDGHARFEETPGLVLRTTVWMGLGRSRFSIQCSLLYLAVQFRDSLQDVVHVVAGDVLP